MHIKLILYINFEQSIACTEVRSSSIGALPSKMATVDSKEYTWAVLYLVGCKENPFTKAPIIPDTLLAAQAIVGIDQEERYVNYNGSIANGLNAQYKLFMLCSGDFFKHLDNIVDLSNAFFNYLRCQIVEIAIGRETAYSLCTSVFPPMTQKNVALRALLTLDEVKFLTKNQAPLDQIAPLRFNPHPQLEENITRYNLK